MQIAIEIDEELYEEVKGYHELTECELAIFNGTVLPEHGRLIDADAFERRCMFDVDVEDMQDVIYALRDYPAIIEATGVEE